MVETGVIRQRIEENDLKAFNCCTDEAKIKLVEFCQQVPGHVDTFLSYIRRLLARSKDKKQVTKEDIVEIAL